MVGHATDEWENVYRPNRPATVAEPVPVPTTAAAPAKPAVPWASRMERLILRGVLYVLMLVCLTMSTGDDFALDRARFVVFAVCLAGLACSAKATHATGY